MTSNSSQEHVPFSTFSDKGLIDAARMVGELGSVDGLEKIGYAASLRQGNEIRRLVNACAYGVFIIRRRRSMRETYGQGS